MHHTSPEPPPLFLGRAVEQELIALDKKFDEARRKGDSAFAGDFLTEDFIQVTQTGVVRTKAELLKSLQTAKPAPPAGQDAPTPSYTVHVHGETAIMTHTIHRRQTLTTPYRGTL